VPAAVDAPTGRLPTWGEGVKRGRGGKVMGRGLQEPARHKPALPDTPNRRMLDG
jgi:hypothetical protein